MMKIDEPRNLHKLSALRKALNEATSPEPSPETILFDVDRQLYDTWVSGVLKPEDKAKIKAILIKSWGPTWVSAFGGIDAEDETGLNLSDYINSLLEFD